MNLHKLDAWLFPKPTADTINESALEDARREYALTLLALERNKAMAQLLRSRITRLSRKEQRK